MSVKGIAVRFSSEQMSMGKTKELGGLLGMFLRMFSVIGKGPPFRQGQFSIFRVAQRKAFEIIPFVEKKDYVQDFLA